MKRLSWQRKAGLYPHPLDQVRKFISSSRLGGSDIHPQALGLAEELRMIVTCHHQDGGVRIDRQQPFRQLKPIDRGHTVIRRDKQIIARCRTKINFRLQAAFAHVHRKAQALEDNLTEKRIAAVVVDKQNKATFSRGERRLGIKR